VKERGQIFTLDMFFALALTVLVVSYSGLALEQARRQAEGYALRYSLERTVNDAADVLLKTAGVPYNWWENSSTLSILGFAEENAGNPIPNTIDIKRFGQFRRLINKDNWDAPINAGAVEAIKKLFGGSEKFEVRILDENNDEMWHAFPRWSAEQVGKNSGAENSLDVAVVRRLISVRYGSAIRADSGPIFKAGGGETENELVFEIYPGELDAFDFYIVVVGLKEGTGAKPNLQIWVNDNARDGDVGEGPDGDHDYKFGYSDIPQRVYPSPEDPPKDHFQHGGIENDRQIEAEDNLFVGTNFLGFKFTSGPDWVIKVCIVMLPACSNWGDATMFLQPLPATLEVKMWR